MNNQLFISFKEEMYKEAKRLVPLVFNDNDFLSCDLDKLKKELNPKFKSFETEFHLLVSGLCISKSEGKDYKKATPNIDELIEHYKKIIKRKKETDNCDLNSITETIVKDIIKNKDKYIDESLFTIIPKLSKKYIKCHHDSVDWSCIVMLLETFFTKKGYRLSSSNLKDLKIIDNKQCICPNCGGILLDIIYGMPDYTIGEKAMKGEVYLGGCMISGNDPIFHCNNCRRSYFKNLKDYIEEENNFVTDD